MQFVLITYNALLTNIITDLLLLFYNYKRNVNRLLFIKVFPFIEVINIKDKTHNKAP